MEEISLGTVSSMGADPDMKDIPSLLLSWKELTGTAQNKVGEEANCEEAMSLIKGAVFDLVLWLSFIQVCYYFLLGEILYPLLRYA